MTTLRALILTVAAIFPPAIWAQSPDRVQVRYVQPDKFTDAARYWGGERERDANLAALARHIERRAAKLLPQGQRLAIAITDLDLAGGFEPWRTGRGDVRVVRDVYPPRIDLSFTLAAAGGGVLKEGERKLRDPAFAAGADVYRDDPLRYEKALLDRWLERELQP